MEEEQQEVTEQASTQQEAPVQQQAYTPFANGKEKFVIDGEEVERDWDTVKKEYSLSSASYKRMEQAAQTEKKAKEFLAKLQSAASTDPEAVIKLFNPNWNRQAATAPNQQNPADNQTDPRDAKISELEQRLSKLDEGYQERLINEERQNIQRELDDVVKKYPILGGKFMTSYVKSEYAKTLRAGMNLSLDDVAFHVAQEAEKERKASDKQKIENLEQNRRKAPVSTVPAGSGKSTKGMSWDDVKKLAGRS